MTDYLSDRRPPTEHLPSYEQMIELCEAYRKAICDQYAQIERHSIERDYWRREFYRLREHCERVTGTSPLDIGPER